MNLLKQTAILGVISSAVFLTPPAVEALTIEEVTNPQSTNGTWVTDMADLLSNETEAELNRLITELEQTNGAEIAVVSVPKTTPATSPKAFATELFNYWGIGKAETDNGILFLISEGDRRVEIETGYGINAILPDAQVKNIIDTKVTPQYKHGNYDSGTLDGTEALIEAISSPGVVGSETLSNQSNWNIFSISSTIGTVFAVGSLFWWYKRRNKVFVDPSKALISLDRSNIKDVRCARCRQPMEKVKIDDNKLTKAQQVARKIGSVSYRGYKCSSCHSLQTYTLLAYTSPSSRYQKCPKCEEFTITCTSETLKKATYERKGRYVEIDRCHCCDYRQENTRYIPRLRRTSNKTSSRGSTSSTYYGGSGGYSGGGSSSGGSSGGGGFGGGSSGGDGAGGSW